MYICAHIGGLGSNHRSRTRRKKTKRQLSGQMQL